MVFSLVTATLYLTALAPAQDYGSLLVFAPPHSHDIYNYSYPIVITCLYTSALLLAELGSCLHPWRASDVGPYPG